MVHAELLPEDKAKIIKQFQKESKIAMVGDGLNDAPALATADIGISMGVSGSALANETGHVILMSNDIRKIPVAVRLARKTRRKIFENIFISVMTKAAIIALAIAGHPLVWAAVLADVGTCLLVIFNSMLLLQGTTSKSMKTHSGSSHNHAQCSSSSSKVKNKCSDLGKKHDGCCGSSVDNVQELKGLVQETKEDGCCAHDDDLNDDSCCVVDDHVHEVNHCIQETNDDCCGHEVKEIHEVKQLVQPEHGKQKHGCCAHEVKDEKHVVQPEHEKEKHGCYAHENDDEIHEVKKVVQPHNADDLVHKSKHSVQETKCSHITKDLESQSCEKSVNHANHENHHHHHHHHHDHLSVNTKKNDDHDHHHDHGHVKEYITGEELGKVMKNCCRSHGLKKRHVSGCCKSFITYKCCGPKYFGGGFNRKGYLSEIVIE